MYPLVHQRISDDISPIAIWNFEFGNLGSKLTAIGPAMGCEGMLLSSTNGDAKPAVINTHSLLE